MLEVTRSSNLLRLRPPRRRSISLSKNTTPPAPRAQTAGQRLKAVRLALGLKPVDVCNELGFAPNKYSQWESGAYRPNLSDMLRFCERYDIPLDWIYRGRSGALPNSIASAVLRYADEG